MTVWEALKQHALLGQQQPLAGILAEHGTTLEPELANALAKMQTLPIEQQVLHAVALLGDESTGLAYLLRDRVGDVAHLVSAIETVRGGGSVVDSEVVRALISARSVTSNSPLAVLTSRETEVLAAMAEGLSNAAIAAYCERVGAQM